MTVIEQENELGDVVTGNPNARLRLKFMAIAPVVAQPYLLILELGLDFGLSFLASASFCS